MTPETRVRAQPGFRKLFFICCEWQMTYDPMTQTAL